MLNKRLQTDSESHVSPLVCIDHEERSNEMGLLTVKVKQRLLIVCFLFFIVLVGALSSAVQLIVESEFVLWNWFVLLFLLRQPPRVRIPRGKSTLRRTYSLAITPEKLGNLVSTVALCNSSI